VVDDILQALPADGTLPVTLKDQKGQLLRYEVRLNQPLFDYITTLDSRLYNGDEQARPLSPNKQTKNFMPNQVGRVKSMPSQEPDCSRPDRAGPTTTLGGSGSTNRSAASATTPKVKGVTRVTLTCALPCGVRTRSTLARVWAESKSWGLSCAGICPIPAAACSPPSKPTTSPSTSTPSAGQGKVASAPAGSPARRAAAAPSPARVPSSRRWAASHEPRLRFKDVTSECRQPSPGIRLRTP
jgi:hypothetical protein